MRKVLTGIVFCLSGMAQAEEVVIAAFGDSLTQGYGLIPEEGLVPQLQGWLEAQGAEVRLINAGVSGDTTAGGLARVEWTLTPEVDAMIVALGGNDLLRGFEPAQTRANLEGIMAAAEAAEVGVLLVGMEAPGNYGPDHKAQFDAIYPELAAAYGSVFLDSFFAGLQVEGQTPDPVALLPYLQGDGIHPNAEGVARIVEGMGPSVLELIATVQK